MRLLRLLGDVRAWTQRRPGNTLLIRYFRPEPVPRDVLLFQHQRPRFFRLLGLFCVAQTGFWAYMAHFGFTSLRDISQSSLIMVAGLLFSRRSVSAVTLKAGGERVIIATAGIFGIGSSFTIPLRHISCMAHRSQVPAMIPLKVKGQPLYFLMDKQGHVFNGKLFDVTVGAYRKL